MPHCRRVFLVTSLLCTVATADSRILIGSDPECADLIAPAAALLNAIADGDAAKARALFAGPARHADLIAACSTWVITAERLTKGIAAKMDGIDSVERALDVASYFRSRSELLASKPVFLAGNRAFFAAGAEFDAGVGLRRSDGQWRVDRLAFDDRHAADLAGLASGLTAAFRAAADDVDAGRAATTRAVLDRLGPAVAQSRLEYVDAVGAGRDRPNPGPPAVVAPTADLVALLGHSLSADPVRRLVARLPDDTALSTGPGSLYVVSPSAGIELSFDEGAGLSSVTLFAAGADGHRSFAGALPEQLTFSDTRRDVERKLGRPTHSGGGAAGVPYWARYPERGLTVTYRGPSAADPANAVHHLTLEKPAPAAAPAAPRAAHAAPRFSIRRAADPSEPGVDVLPDPLDPAGRATFAVCRDALVDERDVAHVSINLKGNTREPTGILLTLTPAGARKMAAATATNLPQRFAIFFDGRLLVAPGVSGPIAGNIHVDFPPGTDFDTARDLVNRLHAAVTVLPGP